MYILPNDAFINVVILTGICEVKLYALTFSTYIFLYYNYFNINQA